MALEVRLEFDEDPLVHPGVDEVRGADLDRAAAGDQELQHVARRGDAAEVALIELIGSEFDPKKAEEEKKAAEAAAAAGEAPKQGKSLGERLRGAAKTIRGGQKKQDAGAKSKASKPARGGAKKTTTPRKAGGS
mgnify:CR=1 FL=1